jgi:predicted MPP superfamily phosphohydrolase
LKEFLSLLDPNIKKVSILGNKEYSGRIDLNVLRETYEAYNGVLLINESIVLNTKFRKINILGIDDLVWGQPDFMMACENIDRSLTSLVLNHCPAYRTSIDESSSSMNLKPIILSGHTHGGQVTFFGIPLMTPYGSGKYVKGWYRNDRSQMYVSKGIGTTILPIRFGARAEVALFYV